MHKKITDYQISINKDFKFIDITCKIPCSSTHEIYLSNWRPGRYEFGDFSKNIRNFQVFDLQENQLKVFKKSRNSWRLVEPICEVIIIKYQYYAQELNSGSTYCDGSLLLVNPINCLVFTQDSFDNPCSVELNIPKSWKVAGIQDKPNNFFCKNFDELADTPFLCSASLFNLQFNIEKINFKIWFSNPIDLYDKQIINDFKLFTTKQLDDFSYFPSNIYEFIIINVDYPHYHGVEHLKSTVITLGPNKEIFNSLYNELLGVSSHELYHVWNIKSFRPKEMTPYNFKEENYSRFGFIYEGITTYLGDLYLLKSNVFSLEQYFKELENQLEKHLTNAGRFNYSLGDSSIDTWIDGYVPGIPGRKVSIYTEGCLVALLLDIQILHLSNGKFSITDFMKLLSIKKEGYSNEDIINLLHQLTNKDFNHFFELYINQPVDLLPHIEREIQHIGLKIFKKHSPIFNEKSFGLITTKTKQISVKYVHPGSTADKLGIEIGDEIISVNNINIQNTDNDIFKDLKTDKISLCFQRGSIKSELNFNFNDQTITGIPSYLIHKITNTNHLQSEFFQKWKN